jgi:triacylglycerol lipase
MMANDLPVILAHGIFRFDVLRVFLRDHGEPDIGLHYFNGIKDFLNANGVHAEESDVSFAGSVTLRARQLAKKVKEVLDRTKAPQVDIIAHSMGGLDARKMIVDEGMADKVRVLTTIGTPHHGTSSADLLATIGGRIAIAAVKNLIDFEGFSDLTTAACRAFNRRANDSEAASRVRYRTVVATESLARTIPLLQPTWIQIQTEEGESDGIVPTISQRWTNKLISASHSNPVETLDFPLPADHLNEIGWWDIGEGTAGVRKQAYEERVREFYLMLAKSV